MRQHPTRLPLAHTPTPIHFLPRLSRELGKDIHVWRDDLTGFTESGNKIRKLEFLAADALEKKATWLITCGGAQSNHARAAAFVARRLGLGITLIIRKPQDGLDSKEEHTGNFLLDRILGAEMRLIDYTSYMAAHGKYDAFLLEAASELVSRGETPYIIPEGGSNALGTFGYLTAVGEMLDTWTKSVADAPQPAALFTALGSGGTYAGLHLGLEAHNLPADMLHAVNVCNDAPYFEGRIHKLFDHVAQDHGIVARDRGLNIHDGYVGRGYALATDEELSFYIDVARKEGMLLDPCYTGKAFRGMLDVVRKDPSRFGKKILFLHSGGGFGTFSHADHYARLSVR